MTLHNAMIVCAIASIVLPVLALRLFNTRDDGADDATDLSDTYVPPEMRR